MKISILVPVYNEEQTINIVLTKLLALKLPCNKEIIVIDDGSTDGTRKRIKNYESRIKNLKIISHKQNYGKGEAIKSGIKVATGDYILIQDADLEYDPSDIGKLLQPVVKENNPKLFVSAVYGTRFKNKKPLISSIYYLGNKFLTYLTNLLYKTNLTDMETGYKLLPMSFMQSVKLESSGFDIEPEITVKLLKAKIPIVEVPITYKGRSHLTGKKLTITDAFAAIKTLVSLKYL